LRVLLSARDCCVSPLSFFTKSQEATTTTRFDNGVCAGAIESDCFLFVSRENFRVCPEYALTYAGRVKKIVYFTNKLENTTTKIHFSHGGIFHFRLLFRFRKVDFEPSIRTFLRLVFFAGDFLFEK